MVWMGPARLSRGSGWGRKGGGKSGSVGGVFEGAGFVGAEREEVAREAAREVVEELGSGGGTPYGE